MSHRQKIQRVMPKRNHFATLSSDIYGLILNSLSDQDIFQSVLFVDNIFMKTIHQKYIVRQRMEEERRFKNGYYIVTNGETEKSRKRVEITKIQQNPDYLKNYEIHADYKNIELSINFSMFTWAREGVAIMDIKTPLLKTILSETTNCNSIEFRNMRGLDLTFEDGEDSKISRINLEDKMIPRDIEKIRMRVWTPGSDYYRRTVRYNPEEKSTKYGAKLGFDYNRFVGMYKKAREMILLFDSETTLGPIYVPRNIERFGIQPVGIMKDMIVVLTDSKVRELIIWHEREMNLHDQNRNKLSVKIIPPETKMIEKLVIRMYEYRLIEGLDLFDRIDHMVIYRTQGINDTQQGFETCTINRYAIKKEIPKMTLISNYMMTSEETREYKVGDKMERIELIRCRFDDMELIGGGLREVVIWKIQAKEDGTYGMIKIPENVIDLTITMDSMKYVLIPKSLKKLRIGRKKIRGEEEEVIREITWVECEITFIDYNMYEYKDELELSECV